MPAPDTISIPAWRDRKDAQWERVNGYIPGLQMIRDRGQTRYMLICSTSDFYEGVVIGQLPETVIKITGSPLKPRRREATEDEKPVTKRLIDLSDQQIDQILDHWSDKRSALSLAFVLAVWGQDGAMQPRG